MRAPHGSGARVSADGTSQPGVEPGATEYDLPSVAAFEPERQVPGWLRGLLVYQRGMDRVAEAVGALPKYLVVAVVVVGFANAVLRYVGRLTSEQLTSNRYLELQWYLFAMIFLLAFAYALKNGVNVRVDFWYEKRSEKTRAAIDFVGHLIALVPFTLIALWVVYPPILTSFGRGASGFRTWRVWEVWEQSPDPGGLPRAPIKAVLFIGLLLLLLQALAELVKLLAVLTGHGHLIGRRDTTGPLRVE